MADLSPLPFVNFGESIAQQGQTNAQTGLEQAQTGLVQQQAQSAAMANQVQKARVPLILRALQDYNDDTTNESGSNATSANGPGRYVPGQSNPNAAADETGTSDPNSNWYNPDRIDAGLRNNFFVPAYTPSEMRQIRQAALSGDPGLIELAKMQREQRISQQTQYAQLGANDMFDGMRAVVNADSGSAMATLERWAPNTVAKIRQQFKSDPNEARDEDVAARQFAEHTAGAVHQYTGREVVAAPDGSYRDKNTGMTVPGIEKVGMTPGQWTDLAKAGLEMKDVPDGAGGSYKVEQWKANGAPSLEAWVMQAAAHTNEHSAQPGVTGAPKAAARAAATTGAAAARKDVGPQQGNYVGADGKVDQAMTEALADPKYMLKMPSVGYGHQPPQDVVDARKNLVSGAQTLRQEVGNNTRDAATTMTYLQAANEIMKSGKVDTGRWGEVIKSAQRWLDPQNANLSNYQELAKYLGNAALANAKATFGSRMTQKEVTLQLEELAPSASMSDQAIKNLLARNIKQTQYVMDMGKRVAPFLGNDPMNPRRNPNDFYTWHQEHFPMDKAVMRPENPSVTQQTGSNQGAAPISTRNADGSPKYSEEQVATWATQHKVPLDKARGLFGYGPAQQPQQQ